MKARILAGMSKGQAQETERKENSKRRNAEKKKEKDEVQLRKHGGQGLRGAARQTTREEDARQFRGTLQPRKRGLPAAGRGKQVRKGKGLSKKSVGRAMREGRRARWGRGRRAGSAQCTDARGRRPTQHRGAPKAA